MNAFSYKLRSHKYDHLKIDHQNIIKNDFIFLYRDSNNSNK